MWRHFISSFAFVDADNMGIVYWKPFVRIHGHTEKTLNIEMNEIMQQRVLRG